jgi:glucose/arabinose dehydrogenase
MLALPLPFTGCNSSDKVAEVAKNDTTVAHSESIEPGATQNSSSQGNTAVGAGSGTGSGMVGGAELAAYKIVRSEAVPGGVAQANGLTVPRGFSVSVFADGLEGPRRLAIAPGGTAKKYDVFVAESRADRVRVLRDGNGDGKAEARFAFAVGLNQPYGLAFHPSGWLYIGNTDAVVRVPCRTGATSSAAKPQFITKLTEGGYNQHWTRNLFFSRDAKKLFVTVGSACNTCEEDDPQRAAISVMNPDGSGRRLYATGLRNPVGLDLRPGTNELWTVVNERDNLGDDLPPDYLTLVRDGKFYGWPYAMTDINGKVRPDPTFGYKNPRKVAETRPPTVPVQAHSAALGLAFYPADKRTRAFPAQYCGDAFLAFHGSWNRSAKTGYKIVRVDFQNGRPVSVTDFVQGYLSGGEAWGRPVDVTVAPDGSLLFSDDGDGIIWRVSYIGR